LGGCQFVDPAGCGIEIRAFCSSSLVRKIEIIIWKPILRIMQSMEREENKKIHLVHPKKSIISIKNFSIWSQFKLLSFHIKDIPESRNAHLHYQLDSVHSSEFYVTHETIN